MATDAGVRDAKTEWRIFLVTGATMVAVGTDYVDVPWDVFFGWLSLGGLGMGGRILQKTVATYTTGKSTVPPTPDNGERRIPQP